MNDKPHLIDTNVILRYLVEDPIHVSEKFRGVFAFFEKLETGEIFAELPELVLFETFFVLTKVYRTPPKEAAKSLEELVDFRGFILRNKPIVIACLRLLQSKSIDLVDAYLLAAAHYNGDRSIYSYDRDLAKAGLTLLDVK